MKEFLDRRFVGNYLFDEWESFFSEICLMHHVGKSYVVKKWVPGEDQEVKQSLAGATSHFLDQLSIHGVLTPKSDFYIEEDALYFVSQYCGKDLEVSLLEYPDADFFRKGIREVLVLIKGVLTQDQDSPILGLDLRLSNFAGDLGSMRYVDPFPPLVRWNDQYWVHWPQPETAHGISYEVERKFKRLGTLRRLRFSIKRLNPDWESIFIEELENVLGAQIAQEVDQFFNTLPDRELQRLLQLNVQEMIADLGPDDKDILREIGVMVYRQNGNPRKDAMERLFRLSRNDESVGYEVPHEVRLNILKEWLIQQV